MYINNKYYQENTDISIEDQTTPKIKSRDEKKIKWMTNINNCNIRYILKNDDILKNLIDEAMKRRKLMNGDIFL
jgi:hypothetical protein